MIFILQTEVITLSYLAFKTEVLKVVFFLND